jgi:Zn-dependent protease with chaperone function
MHTETESAARAPTGIAPYLHAPAGLALYLLTLSIEALLGAGTRWLLVYLGAATVGAIVPLGLSAEALAWIAAAAPLAYSALALALPGRGRLWRRRHGARRPSPKEQRSLAEAFGLLQSVVPNLPEPHVYVLDDPLPTAATRGGSLIVSRGLLDSDSLVAVLAHELGHLHSLDARLTEALARLVLWTDPLAPPEPPGLPELHQRSEPDPHGGLLWAAIRHLFNLAGGGTAERVLAPLWAPYWRAAEYRADAYAATLGMGEDLAIHLADFHQPFDAPRSGLLFKAALHPPVAHRIERLHEFALRGGSK